ncbi:hypothetical protein AVEN_145904-1 [Araneus ventricosus]|uniref:Integrase catalytic domain-containing protein n=1 Tax=Araneus ventricosus TaxID=182803 RepID=A0A4Y2USW1_ARAVE|nr:hypothetical protein AVEN_145904-1 [Araneus ventricosus]
MEMVTDNNEQSTCYYLPHHGVFKPDKMSTKLRVVFNASALSFNGLSLNDIQMNGGLTQEDLFSIMLRFRKHKFVFSADIRKMYRMILVDLQQRDLQRIVWKNGENDNVKTYKLNTVMYDTTSALYLATRVLHQLVKDEGQCFPLAATVLDSDFYMDDVMTGDVSLEAVRELQTQLIRLLATAGMELHKWRTNASNLRSNISEENEYSFSCSSKTKTLGIACDHLTDCFSFKVLPGPQNTKRAVLSNIARIFYPLGILGPVITVDSNGILRVGGRLEYSNLTDNQKHPIILPKSHRLTKLIFVYSHLKNLHGGPQGLLCPVRQKFWPIHGRNLSRKIVNDCITCFRNKPVVANQLMGNLPAERITPIFPFNVCGVDFIGPFLVKPVAQGRITARKMFVAIFVCFVTKAVHFELVTDLTTEAFIACLKKIFARRGKSSIVYSDNATNFVGAQSELKRLSNVTQA